MTSSAHANWHTVQVVANTSTGSQNITTPKLSGATPDVAILWLAATTTLGGNTAHARLSMGFTDGANEAGISIQSEDNSAATDSDNIYYSDAILSVLTTTGTEDCKADVTGFIADGVTINWQSACNSAYVIVAAFGENKSAHVGSFTNPATAPNKTTVTGVGFEADTVFSFKPRPLTIFNEGRLGYTFNMFMGDNQASDVTHSSSIGSQNSQNPSVERTRVEQDEAFDCDLHCDNAQFEAKFTFNNFVADGFDADFSAVTAGQENYPYLAIKSDNNKGHIIDIYDTPTSPAGTMALFTGFVPNFAMCVVSGASAIDTSTEDGGGGMFGFFVTDFVDGFTIGTSTEDNVTPTDTFSYTGAGVLVRDDAGVTAFTGTEMTTATGWDIDFSLNPTEAKKWLCYSSETEAVAASGTIGILQMPIMAN